MAFSEKNNTQEIKEFKEKLVDILENHYHTRFEKAETFDLYKAISSIINDQLQDKRWAFNKKRHAAEESGSGRKKIYYISYTLQAIDERKYGMGSAKSIWEGALTLIRPKITDISLSQWFLPIEPVTVKDDMLVLQVKSELHGL